MSEEIINGVTNHFGRKFVEKKRPLTVPSSGRERELIVPFNYDDLPAASLYPMTQVIPAYSQIVKASIFFKTACAGGTSHTVGLAQRDGTAIDADGLLTAAQLPVASELANTWIDGAGALVGVSIGANDACIVAAATGTYTAGQGKIVVVYRLPELPDNV